MDDLDPCERLGWVLRSRPLAGQILVRGDLPTEALAKAGLVWQRVLLDRDAISRDLLGACRVLLNRVVQVFCHRISKPACR
jgi:hypothetical protein